MGAGLDRVLDLKAFPVGRVLQGVPRAPWLGGPCVPPSGDWRDLLCDGQCVREKHLPLKRLSKRANE